MHRRRADARGLPARADSGGIRGRRDHRDPPSARSGCLGDRPRPAALVTTAEIQLNDPQTLYRHWEAQQWSPFEIDLSRDRDQWPGMSETDRGLIYWALSSLMVAEERITTKFSGLVAAYGSEEEVTFLATQQVDEARHMQFYARFRDEVIDSPGAIASHVARAREQVSPAFRRIFDEALVAAHDE